LHASELALLNGICVLNARRFDNAFEPCLRMAYVHCHYVSAGFGEHFYPNEEENFFYTPILIPLPEPVKQVACGQSHMLILTSTSQPLI